MWLPVAMLVGGVIVGLVAGGRWRAVRTTRVRTWPLGILGLACSILPWIVSLERSTAIIAVGWMLLIAFALRNWRMTGMVIVAIGLTCNLAALVANKAIPVRESAATKAGLTDLGPARRLAEPDDHLEALTAIIPIPALDLVVTFGDLIALLGLADVGFRLARRPAPRHAKTRARHGAHAASKKPAPAPLPAWAAAPIQDADIDSWVLDLRETMRSEERAPALASLAPDDDDDPPSPLEVRYSGQPLPSRH